MLLQVNAHGNSATADKLKTARNIKLQGAISGNANFDGSNDVTINTIAEVKKITKQVSDEGIVIDITLRKQLNIVYAHLNFRVPKNTLNTFTIASAFPAEYAPKENLQITMLADTNGEQFIKCFIKPNGILGLARNNKTTEDLVTGIQVTYIID